MEQTPHRVFFFSEIAHLIYLVHPSSCSCSINRLPPTGLTQNLFAWICWQIWTTRNKFLFENIASHASDLMIKTIYGAREWQLAQLEDNSLRQPSSIGAMTPPSLPSGTIRCNSDASWVRDSLTAGLGWILDLYSKDNATPGTRGWHFARYPNPYPNPT